VIQLIHGERMDSRKERKVALGFLLVGAGYLAYNTRYPLDSWNNPGPGVFPLIVGVTFLLLSAWQLRSTFRIPQNGLESQEKQREHARVKAFVRGHAEARPFLLILVFSLYILLIKGIGFFPSNFLFVVATSRLLGARDWVRPIGLAGGIDLFCYLLFEVWLKLSLPKGMFL